MRALEEDKYVRQIDGYLPSAKVAFIDEVFKANSAILNTLLTILNERLFDNGSARIQVPLICLVKAQPPLKLRKHPGVTMATVGSGLIEEALARQKWSLHRCI